MNNNSTLDIERNILSTLVTWKDDPARKVLLLRGARQVGKTFSVRKLGREFETYLEVNFYETPEVGRFFTTGSLDPKAIIEKLQAYYNVTITPGSTLLFFDEIQACPEAVTALRFFNEKLNQLHVIAAGSLLEFMLAKIPSFGVGRITSLFMYPVSVEEFFKAAGEGHLWKLIEKASFNAPLDSVLHKRAVDLYRTYLLIGGLPEIISTYVTTRNIPKCQELIESLILGYEDDFSKYKENVNVEKLKEVLRASARQAGSKFVYSHVNPGASSYGYDQALELLRLAGLVYKVAKVSGNGIPLGAEIDPKRFKVIPFDVGVYNRLLGLDISEAILQDETQLVNSGALAEVACGIELVANRPVTQRAELYYWAREIRGSNAEVDYLIQKGSNIFPIEVKAGTKGQMQSLYLYLNEKNQEYGFRASLENFGIINSSARSREVRVIPLYRVGSLVGK